MGIAAGSRQAAIALAWHPQRLLLAISWSDGSLTFAAFHSTGALHYEKSLHTAKGASATTEMQWAPGEDTLITLAKDSCKSVVVQRHSELEVDWEPVVVRLAFLLAKDHAIQKWEYLLTHRLLRVSGL